MESAFEVDSLIFRSMRAIVLSRTVQGVTSHATLAGDFFKNGKKMPINFH